MKTTFFFAAACVLSSAIHAAEWIAGSYKQPAESDEAAFFAPARNDVVERKFKASDVEIVSATWRVAAPGMRDLFVNGECVSQTALPPFTPYRKRILEETFDVTAQLRRGADNALRVELGNGWYNPLPLRMWYVDSYNLRDHLAVGTPCVRATLEITYADGVRQTVETDGTWRAAQGKIVHNSIYLGVVEDRRLSVDFNGKARIVKGPEGKVVPAGEFPKVVVYDRWKAKGVTQLSNNVWIVDMGVNATGTLRARLRGVPRLEKFSDALPVSYSGDDWIGDAVKAATLTFTAPNGTVTTLNRTGTGATSFAFDKPGRWRVLLGMEDGTTREAVLNIAMVFVLIFM